MIHASGETGAPPATEGRQREEEALETPGLMRQDQDSDSGIPEAGVQVAAPRTDPYPAHRTFGKGPTVDL